VQDPWPEQPDEDDGPRVKHMVRANSALEKLSGYICEGTTLYQAFNRFGPSRVVRIRHSRLIPPVVVELGDLVGLIYRSDKRHAGQPRTYIHFMETAPRLVTNVEGTQLYIVGGSYRVTPQGIEG
jgi:hypothetical protein